MFRKAPDDIKKLFDLYLDDLDTLFMYLSNYYNVTLYERNSVIILDEIQLYPRARSAIKYLVEDGGYDYIETGSLISIRENVDDILIPSEEEHLKMYPMDNILSLYSEDIKKHSGKYSLKVESIFDEIPSQLQKHEKKV